MRTIRTMVKEIVKKACNKHYKTQTINVEDLSYECDGRIIRSLSSENKKYCATYILGGLK